MDDRQAHEIISSLASGRDPANGQLIEDPFIQRSDVIRALYVAARALETASHRKDRSSRRVGPANAGKPWSEQEDRELLAKFDVGQTMSQIAQAHARTPAGIHARLERHGRVQTQGLTWRGRTANGSRDAPQATGSE